MQKLVLLHGALGVSDDLLPLSDALGKLGIEAFHFLFSGHGHRSSSEFGMEVFTKELEDFLITEKLHDAPVFGYSMGGYVALLLAARGIHKSKVITLGSRISWTPAIAAREQAMLDPEQIARKVPAFAALLQAKHGDGWQKLVGSTANMMHELGEKNPLNDEVLASIGNQVLLGIGDRDTMADPVETYRISRLIPGASMFMLPGTRHPVESADPALLAGIIAGFIARKD